MAVEEGFQLRIEWLDFELEDAWTQKCKFDYVALVDANGQVVFMVLQQFRFQLSKLLRWQHFSATRRQHWLDLLWKCLPAQCGERVQQVILLLEPC